MENNAVLVQKYQEDRALFEAFKDKINSLLKDLFYVSKIKPHQITCRVKSKESLEGKIERKTDKYKTLNEVTDLVGIRIISYFEDEVDKIAKIIETEFSIDKSNSIDKRILEADKFGYRSLHFVVSLSPTRLKLTENTIYSGLKAEIQIRSILQHAWAEIEHDIGYKGENQIPDFAKRGFSRVAALLETADIEFVKLKDALKNYETEVQEEIKTQPESVTLDKASLINYLNHSDLVHEIENEIQKESDHTIYEDNSKVVNLYLERIKYFNIASIKELEGLLEKYKKQLPKFAAKILTKSSPSFPRGISVFYLAYILACKDEDLIKINEFVSQFLKDNKSFTNKLFKAYKETKTE